jgi:transposase
VAVDLLSRRDLSESNVIGDKAYGTNKVLDFIQRADGEYTIPPRCNTSRPWYCDWHIYKHRQVIECFFQKLKWFRRIATRYDKLDDVFLSSVYLASILILLK